MSILENKRKTQVVTIQETIAQETIHYDQYESEYQYQINNKEIQQTQTKQMIMYSLLNSIFRKGLRKPFQKIVIQFHQTDSQASFQVNYKYSRFELQIIQENITSVSKLYRQKLLVDGFLTIKNLYLRKLRVQAAYYSYQNLYRLHEEISIFEKIQAKHLIWSAFGKLYQNFRGLKLSKINLSHIDMISNDFTSRELEEFVPFFSERAKEIQVIHSYIIDKSNENSSSSHDSQNMDRKFQKIGRINLMKVTQKNQVNNQYNNNRTNQLHHINMNKKGDFLHSEEKGKNIVNESTSQNQNRVVKKFTSSHKQKGSEDKFNFDSNILATERKEGTKYETGTTDNKPQGQFLSGQSQHVYLIRDYHSKKKQPSNYVKIPVHTDNIKIVQIHTGRKKNSRHKSHVARKQIQIQQSICQNCKYCLLTRERKQIMKNVVHRFEYNNHIEAMRVQYSQP